MKYLLSIILLFPLFFTILSFVILKKIGFSRWKAFGLAADLTTPFFIISLPIIVKTIWGWPVSTLIMSVLLIVAIIFTFFEWRSQKEINIPLLLKKIWRSYFLLLCILYIVLMIVGFIYWILNYYN